MEEKHLNIDGSESAAPEIDESTKLAPGLSESVGEVMSNHGKASAEMSTPEPVTEGDPPQDETPAEQVVYRWTYADQMKHDEENRRQSRRSGALPYVFIIAVVFAVSFGLLLGVMLMQNRANGGKADIIGTPEEEAVLDVTAVQRAKESVVVLEITKSTGTYGVGSGVVMTSDGYIVTNHHVIENAEIVRVQFYDGTYATAEIIGSSQPDDLAVVKVDKRGLTPAVFASSAECYVGQRVYAIGNPGGAEFAWTTTDGIISYVDRELKVYNSDKTLDRKMLLLQTNAQVNPGNSGGPLVNLDGEVVGIISMKLADGYDDIGFAIPSDGAQVIIRELMEKGHVNDIDSPISVRRPLIGITGVYLKEEGYYTEVDNYIVPSQEMPGLPDERYFYVYSAGVYVSGLTSGMDAERKLKVGDIIVSINGYELASMDELSAVIDDLYPDDTVTLGINREGRIMNVQIVLSEAS